MPVSPPTTFSSLNEAFVVGPMNDEELNEPDLNPCLAEANAVKSSVGLKVSDTSGEVLLELILGSISGVGPSGPCARLRLSCSWLRASWVQRAPPASSH